MWPFKKKALPFPALSEQIEELLRWTPDAAELEKYKHVPLFVCDQSQPGCRDSGILENERRLYTAFTQNNHLMLRQDLGKLSQPLIFNHKPFTMPPSFELLPIRGELFHVRHSIIHALDKSRQNGEQFERKEVLVVIPSTHLFFKDRREAELLFGEGVGTCLVEQAKVTRVKAWMYYAAEDYWKDLLNDYEFPAEQIYSNPQGIVRRYYHYDEPPF